MTGRDAAAIGELRELERELAQGTNGWTLPTLARSYEPSDEGHEDYEDEALILEAHGYTQSINWDDEALTATYLKSADDPTTIVRTYRGKQQADAVLDFEEDAAELALSGYVPTAQSWAAGQWSTGAFVGALLLCVVLIGILVFVYMLIVKPDGTLTVTYELRRTNSLPVSVASAPHIGATDGSVIPDQIRQLGELRDAGLLTDAEFNAKKAELLARM